MQADARQLVAPIYGRRVFSQAERGGARPAPKPLNEPAKNRRIYLDHAATTPLLDVARAACLKGFDRWANPSSPHADGRAAQAMLEDARRRMKAALDWDGEVIFTSGASEALALAILRAKVASLFVSPTEHDVVTRLASDAARLTMRPDGRVDLDDLARQLAAAPDPALVIVQSANNETGVLQDLDAVRRLVADHDGLLLVDASQSAGKLPLPNADFVVCAAHKFGGPPGVGALLLRHFSLLRPVGGQESGYRSGTQNLPYILAMVAALEAGSQWVARAADLRAQIDGALIQAGGEVIAADSPRIPTIASYRMPGVASATQLIRFDMAGFSVSAGSACSSGTLRPSHVLTAMGLDAAAVSEVVRVSFGRDTTRGDVYAFIDEWKRIKAKANVAT